MDQEFVNLLLQNLFEIGAITMIATGVWKLSRFKMWIESEISGIKKDISALHDDHVKAEESRKGLHQDISELKVNIAELNKK